MAPFYFLPDFIVSLVLRDPLEGANEIFFMNFFYDLPDEIQEKIYFEAHKIKYNNVSISIKHINWWKGRNGNAFLIMSSLLYENGATQRELDEYFTLIDWLDQKHKSITYEEIQENKYYQEFRRYYFGA